MSTPRDDLITALNGETPAHTPFCIYEWFLMNEPAEDVRRLTDQGLLLIRGAVNYQYIEHGVRNETKEWWEGGKKHWVFARHTPVGTIQMAGEGTWATEHFLKTPTDYKVMQWIIEHTEIVPDYRSFANAEEELGERGLVCTGLSRTPAMCINVDWAGTENFCLHLAEEWTELFDLYHARKKLFMDEVQAEADGLGRFVKLIENLTISMLGPKWYRELLMPVYEEAFPILRAAGKRVFVHYDGALRVIADQIARAPFDGIESLTEPPEGDMTYDECRAMWPDKVFWANINVSCYALPPEQLTEAVLAKQQRAGKRGLAFEISEDLPANWRETIPVVLRALEQT